MHKLSVLSFLFLLLSLNAYSQHDLHSKKDVTHVIVGAEQTEVYMSMLVGKNVALVINQTSTIGNTLLVDTLQKAGVNIKAIFAPEHGFRGDADAGAHIANTVDKKTGIPVISIYGKKQKPSAEDLKDIDIVVFDIQDVGCRFYTFLSTLQYVMEACAENHKTLIVLDRPNPNGYYVDGPVLDMKYRSFVGVAAIPVVYGLTLGEYAKLAKGENWIADAAALNLKVIPCDRYDHTIKYKLPINPSPNLKDERAIFLYPSLCFFEGTNISVGRGTAYPFQCIGSPDIPMDSVDYTFTPENKPGATDPPFKGKECKGYDLTKYHKELSTEMKCVNIKYLLRMYALTADKEKFFTNPSFFDKLAGSDKLRKQIIAGDTEAHIRATWQPALKEYKAIRKKYLLYKDFE